MVASKASRPSASRLPGISPRASAARADSTSPPRAASTSVSSCGGWPNGPGRAAGRSGWGKLGGGGEAPSASPSSGTEGRCDGVEDEARLARRESEADGRRPPGPAQASGCEALLEVDGPSPDEPIVVLLKRLGSGFWTTPPLSGEEELGRSSDIGAAGRRRGW